MSAQTDLSNIAVSTGFKQLLHIGDTNGVEATEHYVVDGDGTASALSLGTTAVGIGTDSPAGNLEIQGGDGTVSGTPDADGNEFVIRNNADAGMSLMAGESSGHTSSIIFGSTSDINGANILYEYNTKTMKLGTQHSSGILTLRSGNGTDALTIDSSGNVGIGTANPDERLHVTGPTGGPYVAIIQNMDTSGGANQIHFKDGSGDTCGTIVSNATNNTTAYNQTSDYRLKENEVLISDGITRLNQLRPYSFNFISNPDKIKVDGFFAHEVSDIVPEAISGEKDAMMDREVSPSIEAQEEIAWGDELPTDENTKDEIKAFMDSYGFEYNSGDTKQDLLDKIPSVKQEAVEAQEAVYETVPDYQGIDHSKLVPLLVAAVQELSAKVEALENK